MADLYAQIIKDAIQSFEAEKQKMIYYKNYYEGKHDILKREIKGEIVNGVRVKPNNKIPINLSKLVVLSNQSYLFGKPITYYMSVSEKDEHYDLTKEFYWALKDVFESNDETEVTKQHGKNTRIMGKSIEFHFINDDEIKFKAFPGTQWIEIGSEDSEFHFWLRFYHDTKYIQKDGKFEQVDVTKAQLVSKESVKYYEAEGEDEFKFDKEVFHYYGEIPVIEFLNGDEGLSDLTDTIEINNQINLRISDLANTLEANGNPYLVLKNFNLDALTDEDKSIAEVLSELLESKTLLIDGQGEKEPGAEYLTLDMNVEAHKFFLEQMIDLLFQTSLTPNFNDKELGNMSGVAMKMRFILSDLKANEVENSFRKGLRKRIRLIAKQLENKTNKPYFTNGVYKNIGITFNRNIPQNIQEIADYISKLHGIISNETLISQIPFVDDVHLEMNKKEQEQGIPIDFGDDSDDNEQE